MKRGLFTIIGIILILISCGGCIILPLGIFGESESMIIGGIGLAVLSPLFFLIGVVLIIIGIVSKKNEEKE